MTEEPNEVQVWAPQMEFTGSDLLPTARISNVTVRKQALVGREDIAPDDIILPALSLLQGMSDPVQNALPGCQPGKFYNEVTGDVFDAPLRGLLVHYYKSRAAFTGTKEHNVPQQCISRDAVTGNVFGECATCQYAEWQECSDGKQRQPCALQHNFVLMTETGPIVLRLKTTSTKGAKKFLTAWGGSNNNLWDFPVIITTTRSEGEVDGQKVSYYTMAIRWEMRDPTPDDWREQALAVYEQIHAAHESGNLSSSEDAGQVEPDL